jgi:hypothetical protein
MRLDGADKRRLGGALDAAARPFPGLDANTRTLAHSDDGAILVAAMAHSPEVGSPRRFLSRGERELVLHEGLPVHTAARFPAHDARCA